MDFDLKIIEGNLTIYCSKNLEEFSKEFIEYCKKNINDIKNKLNIKENVNLVVALTDDKNLAGFVYEESDFSYDSLLKLFNEIEKILHTNSNPNQDFIELNLDENTVTIGKTYEHFNGPCIC